MTALPPGATTQDAARAAATAAAGVLPSEAPLSTGNPLPGTEGIVASFAGAVVADLEGPVAGRLAILVGEELVAALASSPLGGLDLAAAVQPTLDAAAEALGARAGAAREVDLRLVVADFGGPFTTVPLVATEPVAALLLPETTLLAATRHAADGADGQGAEPAPSLTRHEPTQLGGASKKPGIAPRRGIELLHGVDMEVTVEIGRTRMTVRDLLDLSPGAVLELDRAAGSPADLLVNGHLIARGEVVVVDEDFGLRVTEIVTDAAAG